MKLQGTTYGDQLDPAMKIETQEEADQYFELLVSYQMGAIMMSEKNPDNVRERAEETVRINLGYWTGYYDQETAARVFQLFNTTHPIFGGARPTMVEAFEAGKRLAK